MRCRVVWRLSAEVPTGEGVSLRREGCKTLNLLEADLAEDSAALPFIERRAERETASNSKY